MSKNTRGIELTWIEKYITYRQDHKGRLTLTDYHFLAEIIYSDKSAIDGIETLLFLENNELALASYEASDPNTFTNGYYYTRKSKSYDDLASLENGHPADNRYIWQINMPEKSIRLDPICIGGPEQRTQFPEPSPVFLSQNGVPVEDYENVQPELTLTISWNPFSNGETLEGSEWDDLVFVLVSNCHGEVVFTGGAPGGKTGFIDYRATSSRMPAGVLESGMEYVVFISQVKYVDNNTSHGIEQLAANSFAVELPVKTAGSLDPGRKCPRPAHKASYLWSGKTPADIGMVPWPTLLDPSNVSS